MYGVVYSVNSLEQTWLEYILKLLTLSNPFGTSCVQNVLQNIKVSKMDV